MAKAASRVPVRPWVILLLALWAATANSWYQGAIPATAPFLRSELGLEIVDLKYVFAARGTGLAVGSVVMVALISLVGVRLVYGTAILGASLAMALLGTAQGLSWLMVGNVCLGFFNGAFLAGGMQVVAEWFPPQFHGVAIGLFLGAVELNRYIGPLVTGLLWDQFGRSYASLLLAGLGLLAFPFWVWLCRPERVEDLDAPAVPRALTEVFRAPQTLGLILGVALASPAAQFGLSEFLRDRHNADLAGFGWMLAIPMVLATAGGALVGGVVSDLLIWFGWPVSKSRTRVALASALVIPLLLGVLVPNPRLSLVFAGLSVLGYRSYVSVLYAAVADSVPKRGFAFAVLLASSWSNTSGSWVGMMSVQVVPKWGDWPVVLGLAMLAAIAAVVTHVLPQEPEHTEEAGAHAWVPLADPQGGFWRRLASLVLDIAICGVPVGIVVIIVKPMAGAAALTMFAALLSLTLQWLYFAGLGACPSNARSA